MNETEKLLHQPTPRARRNGLFRLVRSHSPSVLAAGVAVRACFIASYRPGFFGYYDAVGYLGAANLELFGSPYRPAGEPALVWVLRRISPDLSVTVAAHHLVGLATALVLYATARKAGARAWLAAFPAGVVLLGGTQIFLEHSTMSEPLFTPSRGLGHLRRAAGLGQRPRLLERRGWDICRTGHRAAPRRIGLGGRLRWLVARVARQLPASPRRGRDNRGYHPRHRGRLRRAAGERHGTLGPHTVNGDDPLRTGCGVRELFTVQADTRNPSPVRANPPPPSVRPQSFT